MQILSDDEWARLKAALDAARSGAGRPLPDERRTVEAVVWRQRNGAEWRAAPAGPGPWWKAAQLHIRWSRAGVWARAFERLREAGRPDLGEVFLDGASVRAHQKAAGGKGGRGPRPSAARAAAGAARPTRPATAGAARSPPP
jgi:transposase